MKPKTKHLEKPKKEKPFYYSQLNFERFKKKEPIIEIVGETKTGMSASSLHWAKAIDQELSDNLICKDCGKVFPAGLIAGRCRACNKKKMVEIRKENKIYKRLGKVSSK